MTPEEARKIQDARLSAGYDWCPDDMHDPLEEDMADTIAGMRWEYAVEMLEEQEWKMVGIHGPDEPWASEDDARYTMDKWQSYHPIRLVCRLVGPVEVVE